MLDAKDIRHRWLTDHLGWQLTGDEAITVRSISLSAGEMGPVDRISCAGRSFVLKGPPPEHSTWGALLRDMSMREVQSYRLLGARGPHAPKISPACYWSEFDEDGRGALALEDLGAPQELAQVMAAGLNRSQAAAAVRSLALAHAAQAATGADPLTPPYPWLYTAASEGLVAAVEMGLDDLRRVLPMLLPEPGAGSRAGQIRDVHVAGVLAQANVDTSCVSICHGDAWAGNILFAHGSSAGSLRAFLIDWQFTMWGNPLTDIALLLMSSVDAAACASWDDELLGLYHATLTAHSDIDYPMAECRADYRRAQPFAVLVMLATLEGYIRGMDEAQLARFTPRVRVAVDRALTSSVSWGAVSGTRP
ncbi:phosphotransferase [Streptomyces sp. NPDC093510]|uniref:phosphotransferase n=1 Tax=Streptomyces sp. NPDC093510 TaxID=3155199 RepID=UPI00342D3052